MEKSFFEDIEKLLPLETQRACFNLMTLNDFLKIREYMNTEPIDKLTCRPIKIVSTDEAIKYFENTKENKTAITLGIYLQNSSEIIGRVSIFDYNQRNNTVEIGYFILPNFRKNGYAMETIELLKDLILSKLNLNKILAQTASFNKHSISLLEKSGFSITGILKEHHELNGYLHDDYIYYLLKSQL